MRKKIILLTSLLTILLLAGCAAEQPSTKPTAPQQKDTTVKVETKTQPQTQPQTQAQVETKEEIIKETPPEPEPTVTVEPPTQLPSRVEELITKAKTKVNSYKYLMKAPPENRFLDTYFVKGDKIKIKIYEGNAYILGKYYDTIYLDKSAKTATARCEDERRCISRGEDYTKKVFNVEYDEYITKTPMEWLKEITNAKVIGPHVVNGVSTLKIKTTKPGQIIEMWLHTTYGIPIKIEITESGKTTETYEFADTTFNNFKDADVTPAFTTEQN
ncbi:hypothetical protein GF358_02740 [Candidatus Woesearchaeota archaeon]|nr:hypothetical protein [Candidatus Woesearchaeota archaeon]